MVHEPPSTTICLPIPLSIFCRRIQEVSPFHGTDDSRVEPNFDAERLEVVATIVIAHQLLKGWGGKPVGLYDTRWARLSRTSWERKVDLQRSRPSHPPCVPGRDTNSTG